MKKRSHGDKADPWKDQKFFLICLTAFIYGPKQSQVPWQENLICLMYKIRAVILL